MNRRRTFLLLLLVVAAGLASRLLHTGTPLLDKYPGDALYAVMVFLLLRLVFTRADSARLIAAAAAVMLGLELFQLTDIPLGWSRHAALPVRLAGRLLGTAFSWLDLLAYAAGLAAAWTLGRFSADTAGAASFRGGRLFSNSRQK